jgi:hypothetical protein
MAPSTNLLTATPGEAAILIAAALGSAADLLHLAVACRRFALKCIAARPPPPSGAAAASKHQLISNCSNSRTSCIGALPDLALPDLALSSIRMRAGVSRLSSARVSELRT